MEYEEIVKALEDEKEFLLREEKRTGNAPDTQLLYIRGEAVLKILDLIHRLQDDYSTLKERYIKVLDLNEKVIAEQKAEIERLTSLYDGKSGFMTSSIGDLPLTVEGLRKAVDEISRLLTVQGDLQDLNAKYYNEAKDLRRENTELQKQVDELLNRRIEPKIFQCHANALENCPKVEQAVKDTAKDSLEQFVCAMVNMEYVGVNDDLYYQMLELKDTLLKEKYGVEVE